MKKTTMTREETAELAGHIGAAGKSPKGDSDDLGMYKKFKYACGKNRDRLLAIAKRTNRLIDEALNSHPPAYDEFIDKCEESFKTHAKKDENGDPVTRVTPGTQQEIYVLDPPDEAAANEEVEALKKEYEVTLSAMAGIDEKIAAIKAEPIEIELHTIPFEHVPERMASGYYTVLEPMLVDLPKLD